MASDEENEETFQEINFTTNYTRQRYKAALKQQKISGILTSQHTHNNNNIFNKNNCKDFLCIEEEEKKEEDALDESAQQAEVSNDSDAPLKPNLN
ncbi:hypothetical protein FF38_05891 [Lucilia cuprina]|uniref:Uncharacterized protein n=1 Tax=Lucilia cuprina TaxID=7375 RepID=A0A0L0BQR6_LUCCU|nr:hypothetical protein FF38_05891 [Lucilia cuprina]